MRDAMWPLFAGTLLALCCMRPRMDVLPYILAAYGATAVLIAGLVIATWWRAQRTEQQLNQAERSD